jgi:hypothetical protein
VQKITRRDRPVKRKALDWKKSWEKPCLAPLMNVLPGLTLWRIRAADDQVELLVNYRAFFCSPFFVKK